MLKINIYYKKTSMIEDVFLYGKIENKKILTLTDQVRILKYIIKRGLLGNIFYLGSNQLLGK